MILAKNNLIVKIENSQMPEYAILNPISGSFDIMSETEHSFLEKIKNGAFVDQDFISYMLERGYAFNNADEQEKAIAKAYDEFKEEIQGIFSLPIYN